jgi:uncharacterized protein (DUF58 family)
VVDAISAAMLREGDATVWRAAVSGDDALDVVAAVSPPSAWFDRRPSGGVVTGASNGTTELAVELRARRWGRHTTEQVRIDACSPWGAFRWSSTTSPRVVVVLPVAAEFGARASFRPATGLVGLHRSSQSGEGMEFASVRPFVAGDRMRRVNWPRSLRAGTVHVNTSWSDRDTHVALLLDTTVEGNLDATSATSLDTTVRAAAAIAEHYARQGDRLSLGVLGGIRRTMVPPGTGIAHLRRVLDALTTLGPSVPHWGATERRAPLTGDVLVIMLSPLITREALDRAVALGRRGVAIAVVDTLPEHLAPEADERSRLAWRIRLLERAREVRVVQEVGVPVLAWKGAGSLDEFLRGVSRRAGAPRVRVR